MKILKPQTDLQTLTTANTLALWQHVLQNAQSNHNELHYKGRAPDALSNRATDLRILGS